MVKIRVAEPIVSPGFGETLAIITGSACSVAEDGLIWLNMLNHDLRILIVNSFNVESLLSAYPPPYDYILVNCDLRGIIGKLRAAINRRALIISYGLSKRACVTASSIADDKITACVQRAFPNVNGQSIEQQEFAVNGVFGERNVSDALSAVTLSLILSKLP